MSLDPMISYQRLAEWLRNRAAAHKASKTGSTVRVGECLAIAQHFEDEATAIKRARQAKGEADAEP